MAVHPFRFLPSASATTVTGTSADDVLAGYLGNDTLFGGAGDDLVVEGQLVWTYDSASPFQTGQPYDLGSGNDSIFGGEGFDRILWTGSTIGGTLDLAAATYVRGTQTDRFDQIERLELGGGNDRVVVAEGTVEVDAGTGVDTLDLRHLTGHVVYHAGAISIDEVSYGRYSEMEVILLATAANNQAIIGEAATVYGGQLTDLISSRAGSTLYGGGGNDGFSFDAGPTDSGLCDLYGGEGMDTLNFAYDRVDVGAILDVDAGTVRMQVGDEEARFESIEWAYLTDYDDVVVSKDILRMTLALGLGNDSVVGGLDNTTVFGGNGWDRFDFSSETEAIVIDQAAGVFTVGGRNAGRVQNVEELVGSRTATNLVRGNATSLWYEAGDAADELYGGGGDDRLSGGIGADLLEGGTGNDVLIGSGGTDTLRDLSGESEIYGGDGEDLIEFSYGLAQGGDDDDILRRRNFDEVQTAYLSGGDGDDEVYGGSRDTVSGGAGNDILAGRHVNGGTGNDRIDVLGNGRINGGGGNDTIDLDSIRESGFSSFGLDGGGGNDVVTRLTPTSSSAIFFGGLNGGAGLDTLNVRGAGLSGAQVYNFEVINFSEIDDVLSLSLSGRDIDSGSGDDWIGLSGADATVELGLGEDTASLTGDRLVAYGGIGNDEIDLKMAGNIAYGGDGDDNLRIDAPGGLVSDGCRLYGGDGNDRLLSSGYALPRNVTLDGGAGNDRLMMTGPEGLMTGGLGDDIIEYQARDGQRDVSIYGGAGADRVEIDGWVATLDLGAGDDLLAIKSRGGQFSETVEVVTGRGADIVELLSNTLIGRFWLTDFNVDQDRLRTSLGTSLSDWDEVVDTADGVRLSELSDGHQLRVVLVGVTLAQLTDEIFL